MREWNGFIAGNGFGGGFTGETLARLRLRPKSPEARNKTKNLTYQRQVRPFKDSSTRQRRCEPDGWISGELRALIRSRRRASG